MRVLLSVVGTRGDVQPVMALALEVRKLGHEVGLCLPPNFTEWARTLGFEATSVGIEMRAPRSGSVATKPVADLIADQFEAVALGAKGADIILGANAHQYAARSIAELYRIPYVNAVYAPTALPADDNIRAWNERSRERVNANRQRLKLAPIDDVLRHIITERPWLASDPTLAPKPSIPGIDIVQTGAWIFADSSSLTPDVDEFLGLGEPPVYFGFGSMPVADGVNRTLIEAARAVGRRAVISRGWGDLGPIDESSDCISIDDVNHGALFPRVAAVVHHGGAGTTLAAVRARAPQVVIPLFGDQPFWARRVCDLGIGVSVSIGDLTVERLASALNQAFEPAVAARADHVAAQVVMDGAAVAAQSLVNLVSKQS